MPKVEDGTSGLEKRAEQARDPMAEMTGKNWLAELLSNDKIVGLLLLYLKDTEVGSRMEAMEEVREWKKKSDQKEEEHLGNL